MRRRDFLKTTAGGAVTAAVAPAILGATDKAGSKNTVVGSGEHRYECFHDWGRLPPHLRWETTHGVAIDGDGFVYIKQQGHAGGTPMDTVVVFDPTGKYVRSFGNEYYPGGHGIDVRSEGRQEFLYLCDIHHRQVIKTDLKGEEVWKLCYPTEAHVYDRVKKFSPTNVAFAHDGSFYVGDGYGSNYIHQYDRDAKWVRTWGGTGTGPGKMRTPHGLWLDDRPGRTPALVVADRANARLQYFSLDGKFQGIVNDMLFPAHFDIRGDVLMVPDLHARITLLDRNNKVLVHLGDDADWRRTVLDGFKVRMKPELWRSGRFVHPHDACFDRDGNIYVTEWVHTGRVSFLRRVG
jgi:hypothetical protein